MSFGASDTLVVPMGLKALVMPTDNGQQGWDRRPMQFANLNQYQSPVPPVFGSTGNQQYGTLPGVGVHLYWTLPRALTTALTRDEVLTRDEALLSAKDRSGTDETHDTPYPYVPNRWLVVRITEGDAPTAVAWVLTSDEEDKKSGGTYYVDPGAVAAGNVVAPIRIGVARALADWQSDTGSDIAPFLTAVGPGDATFAAFTPGAGNLFCFYDDLGGTNGLATGSFSYVVTGWYSNPAADPINPSNPINAQGVGWTTVGTGAGAVSSVPRLGWNVALGGATPPMRTLTSATLRGVSWNRSESLPVPAQFKDFASVSQQVKVALANTSAEGVSAMAYEAMLAAGQDKRDAARKALELEALQYRALGTLDHPAGRHLLADRIKRASYSASDGGYLWEVVPVQEGDLSALDLTEAQAEGLAALNRNQRALDEALDVLSSMQLRLYSLWWQQQSIPFASTPPYAPYQQQFTTAKDNLKVPKGATLSKPVTDYLEQVKDQIGNVRNLAAGLPSTDSSINAQAVAAAAAGFLDPARQTLRAVPRPGFFAPTDPVFVIAGAGRLSDPQPNTVMCRLGDTIQPSGDLGAKGLPAAAAAKAAEAQTAAQPGDQTWEQPWAPLYLDWQMRYYYAYEPGKSPNNVAIDRYGNYKPAQSAWAFDGRTYQWVGGPMSTNATGPLETGFAKTYSGRTFLAPHASRNMYAQLSALADGDGVAIDPAMLEKIVDWSVLSQTASGLTQLLAMRDTSANVAPAGSIAAAVMRQKDGVPAPGLMPTPLLQGYDTGTPYFFPMRAGFWCITGLRLTDSFGRIMNLMSANGGSTSSHAPTLQPILPPSMVPPAGTDSTYLGLATSPPRLVQPSRLALRYVDGTDDSVESDLVAGANPICGWLLPNHADRSIAVYDTDGKSLGSLQPFALPNGGAVLQWVPTPGGQAAPGAPSGAPAIDNANLLALVEGLLSAPDGAGALADLVATLDQSGWQLDPGEDRSSALPAVLLGHPVAVVRCNLQLQLKGLALTDQSYEKIFDNTGALAFHDGGVGGLAFDLSIGARELRRDGVAGYYLGGDYSCLNAVVQPHDAKSGYIVQAGAKGFPTLSPVETPLNSAGTMDATGSLYATLLVDPRGDVHVTSGILPRVRRELPEKQVAQALRAMAMSVQVGPILLDPDAVRMPLPALRQASISWLSAQTPDADGWQTDPVLPSDGSARPMPTAPVLQEGWLLIDSVPKPQTPKD